MSENVMRGKNRAAIRKGLRKGERFSSSLRVASCLAAITATVLGCSWPGTDHSVRFNGYREGKEFGRLPPLLKYEIANGGKLFSWDADVEYDYFDYEERQSRGKNIDALWGGAEGAEHVGDLALLRKNLSEYLDLTKNEAYARWNSPKDVQARRNSAIDKLDAFTALDEGAPASDVLTYMTARSFYDKGKAEKPLTDDWQDAKLDKRLKDNKAYLEAAYIYSQDAPKAVEKFERIAAKYPRSEKREAALYMAALAAKNSRQGCPMPEPWAATEPCEQCRDAIWHKARAGFERVMREYPRGRYYSDARGWLAHLSLQVGDRAEALALYYKMLADKDEASRAEALASLHLVRSRADDSDMARVERMLENDPAAALAYSYHNIYNFALPSIFYSYVDDPKREEKRADTELKRIAAFATRMMNRYPSTAVGGSFVLRVAQANLELGNDKDAASLARQALSKSLRGDARAEALWVAGVAEHRLRQYESARKALTTLVAENLNNRYTEGARRNLAMLAEDMGDMEGALDQYLALDYRQDVTYFIDVLMTADQLAAFINKRPAIPQRDELLYALGVRYLRDRRWADARQTLSKVRTLGRGADEDYLWRLHRNDSYNYSEEDQPQETPKEMEIDHRIKGVRPQWVAQDLRTANDLERLEREVESAEGDEAKAEALYQYASYQYEGTLLFYNPAWAKKRHYLLYDLDHSGAFRQPNESQTLFEDTQKQDRASRALPIYLEVVRRFPNTRAARDALYTAAICHERLADYNAYWRAIYSEGGHAGERFVDYSDVRAAYPGYRFPRGTRGWEPSTRTVNGGQGWVSLPKPKPRPSKWARALKISNALSAVISKTIADWLATLMKIVCAIWRAIIACVLWVCHWLWIIYLFLWVRFLWRRATESRTMMSEALKRCEPRPKVERESSKLSLDVGAFSSMADKYLSRDVRDDWEESAQDLIYKLRQVARHKSGRSMIASYSAMHGLLILLLFRVLIDV